MCKGCTLGKYAKSSIPNKYNKAKGILDLVHYDVCGPFSTVSLSEYKYYVTLIDDHSRKTYMFFDEN